MKHIKTILVVAFAITLSTGCKKSFINLQNSSAFTEDNYYRTASDINGALIAAYSSLQPVYDTWYRWGDLLSDDTHGRSDGSGENLLNVFTITSTNTNVYATWQALYKSIALANKVIEAAPPVAMDSTLKVRFIGQAKFIRALCYFNLVRLFGKVPVIKVTIKKPDEALAYLRKTTQEVYTQIIQDLTDAETALPPKYDGSARNEVGRATSVTAKTMLGEVYMTQKNWADAAIQLNDAITLVTANNPNPLIEYNSIFASTNGNNAEIIFAIQYQKGRTPKEGSSWCNYFAPSATLISAGTAYGYNTITKDLFNAYETGDLRKAISVGVLTGSSTLYYTRKYLDPTIVTNADADNDWIVYRYADLLLLHAEALNELKDTTNALVQLNKVRARAGLTAKKDLTQANTRLAIEKERRVELSCEGHRWFDLVRTGRVYDVMVAHFKAFPITGGTAAPDLMKKTNYLLPIPDQERTINPGLSQNKGYD
jgi:hypothetical protein